MKYKTTLWIWIWIAFIFLLNSFFYTQIRGDQIITHWNIQNVPDGYGPKWTILAMPLFVLFLDALQIGLRKIDPKKLNYAKFEGTYRTLRISVALIFGIMCILMTIAQIYPEHVNIGSGITMLVGCLFLIMGNLMPRIRPNWFAGFRTPWTLANETVWLKTHRIAGRLWFVGGILMLGSAFLPSELLFWVTMGITFIITAIPFVYSFMLYRYLNKKGDLI